MRPQRFLHLVAHRGNAFEFPENTLPALRSAVELGARFVALDVQLSADGVPMVIRDSDLARSAGVPGSVFDFDAAALATLDVSEPRRFGAQFRGTCIPRLAQVVAFLEKRPELTAFVEIQRASLARFGHDQAVSIVLEALRPVRQQCVITSSDLPAVYRARHMAGFQIGWEITSHDSHTRLKYEALLPEFLLCSAERLPPRGVLWRGPWRWAVCGVSSMHLVLELLERGADFVTTAHVRALSAAMREHARAVPTGAPAP